MTSRNGLDDVGYASERVEQLTTPEQTSKKPYFETFYGFIEDPMDALHVIEGCVRGNLIAFQGTSIDMARVNPRSGTVIVVPDNSIHIKRWRDNIKWSPSRAYGKFILYRQIESGTGTSIVSSSTTTLTKDQPSKYAACLGGASITGLEPVFSKRTLKPNTRLVENGLTKRTITILGSDRRFYRIISYYTTEDVLEMTSRNLAAVNADMAKARHLSMLFQPPQDLKKRDDWEEIFRRASWDPELSKLNREGNVHYGHLLADSIGYDDSKLRSERVKLDLESSSSGNTVDSAAPNRTFLLPPPFVQHKPKRVKKTSVRETESPDENPFTDDEEASGSLKPSRRSSNSSRQSKRHRSEVGEQPQPLRYDSHSLSVATQMEYQPHPPPMQHAPFTYYPPHPQHAYAPQYYLPHPSDPYAHPPPAGISYYQPMQQQPTGYYQHAYLPVPRGYYLYQQGPSQQQAHGQQEAPTDVAMVPTPLKLESDE
ncbi:hypothetical protein HDU98_011166 [Podochytrium sp. JEL0797]|nr:hypothetical protein HDU98_011166 [Podochytrium sp. JEL0797]